MTVMIRTGWRHRMSLAGGRFYGAVPLLGALTLLASPPGVLALDAAHGPPLHAHANQLAHVRAELGASAAGISAAVPGIATLPGWSMRSTRSGTLRGSQWRLPVIRLGQNLGSPWKREGTPNGSLPSGALLSESCHGSVCTAVGWRTNNAGNELTLAERWLGGRWRPQRTRNPANAIASVLFGVSCSASRACTAAGYYINRAGRVLPLAERWRGNGWRIQPTAEPAGATATGFFGVSCSSAAACMAVGTYNTRAGSARMLTESWNGVRWRIRTAAYHPGDTELSAVSCTWPADCTAVGSYSRAEGSGPLAERWNGRKWINESAPGNGGGLSAVACYSAHACTAVGAASNVDGNLQVLAEQWNGRRWRVQVTPRPSAAFNEFLGVSCTSARACTAVGDSAGTTFEAALAEHWNGRKWRIESTPSLGANASVLTSVSCSAARTCTSVGIEVGSSSLDLPLAEDWNGVQWRVRPSAIPAGASRTEFNGVSCTSVRSCLGVGYNDAGGPLAEGWDGVRWRLQPVPFPIRGYFAQFEAVSCPSARACTAVGYADNGRYDEPIAERWNGTRWAVQSVPRVAGLPGGILQTVSCSSANSCIAAGFNFVTNGSLVERWNGTSWATQNVPYIGGLAGLSGIACISATACTMVGGVNDGNPDGPVGLVETWNGTVWTSQELPPGTPFLNAVSCTAADACTAVGDSDAGPAAAVAWNGSTWTAQSISTPAGDTFTYLLGVSCTSDVACTAVGEGARGVATPDHIFAEQWDGTSWRLQVIPNPAGSQGNYLVAVSCSAASACTAVGNYLSISGINVSLAEARAP